MRMRTGNRSGGADKDTAGSGLGWLPGLIEIVMEAGLLGKAGDN